MQVQTNHYLENKSHHNNLLNEYFELLSSNKQKPQIWNDLLGNDEISCSESTFFLLSFLLLKVYEYSYEEALQKVDKEWLEKHKFTYTGIGKFCKIRSTKGFVNIIQAPALCVSIIYNDWDLEKNLMDIYKCEAKYESSLNQKKTDIYREFLKINKLLENV